MSRGAAPRDGARSQTWTTFVRNHASAVLACDFFVTVTATFRVLYVFVVLEVGTRRILHWNVTEHPTAEWTAQQLRMVVTGEQAHRWLIHDRDSLYSESVDATVAARVCRFSRTPVQTPQANAFCERLIGTIWRECLDWLIPVNERHVDRIMRAWVAHYNQGRPHASLGAGIPDPPTERIGERSHRHHLPGGHRVRPTAILGGLHHEYCLEKAA
jgi:transposase InsO family protein